MWKWIALLIPLGMLTMSGMAYALTTEEVTLEATGANITVCDPPTNFVVTVVSDFEVSITWTSILGGNGTIIRAQYLTCPADETDGTEVYSGTGNSTTFAIDTTELICFRAWSDCGSGVVSSTYAEFKTSLPEGDDLVFFALVVLCLGLSGVSVMSSFGLFRIGAAVGWIGIMAYVFVYPPGDITAGSPTQTILALCFFAMAVAVPIMGLGRDIRQQNTQDGVTTSGLSWRMSKLKWGKGDSEEVKAQRSKKAKEEDEGDYRDKLRKAQGRNKK